MTFECVKGPAARDTRLSIRVPRSLKKNIERRAAKEGRTIADTVISIVEQALKPHASCNGDDQRRLDSTGRKAEEP